MSIKVANSQVTGGWARTRRRGVANGARVGYTWDMSEDEIRYPPWDGGDDQLENDLPQWKATTQDILRQVDAVKGHRQKYVTYPDGTRYRVKRAKDADYTNDTGHEVEVWELVPEP